MNNYMMHFKLNNDEQVVIDAMQAHLHNYEQLFFVKASRLGVSSDDLQRTLLVDEMRRKMQEAIAQAILFGIGRWVIDTESNETQ